MVSCSVIVTSYNCLPYNKVFWHYYRKFTHDPDVQLVWVDNNSTDGTREWVSDLDLSHTILLDKNEGAGKARNIAVNEIDTDAVCFMDNDIRPTQVGWIDRLLRLLYRSDKIGAVAPSCNLIFDDAGTHSFREPIDKIWARIPAYKRKDAAVFHWDEDVYPYVSKYLSILKLRPFMGNIVGEGGGTTMRKSTFLDIGGYPHEYSIGHEGQTIGYGLRDKQLQMWVEPSVFLFHYGHATRNYQEIENLDKKLDDANEQKWARQRHYMERGRT